LASFRSSVSKPSVNQSVDRREKLASLIPLALIAPEPRHAQTPALLSVSTCPSAIFIPPFIATAPSVSGGERLTVAMPAFTLFQVIVVIRAGWIAIVSVFLYRTHD
jgi:hypothetical protein